MKVDGIKVGDKIKGKVLHSKYSRYMQRLARVEPELVAELIEKGHVLPITHPSPLPARYHCLWQTT